MDVLDQKEVTVGDVYYVITALGAEIGMDIIDRNILGGEKFSPKDIKSIIIRSVSVKGKMLDDKSFSKHFSRKYNELMELFNEIMEFNFGKAEEIDPNSSSDNSEEVDTLD